MVKAINSKAKGDFKNKMKKKFNNTKTKSKTRSFRVFLKNPTFYILLL